MDKVLERKIMDTKEKLGQGEKELEALNEQLTRLIERKPQLQRTIESLKKRLITLSVRGGI